jgi:hypothetical protein
MRRTVSGVPTIDTEATRIDNAKPQILHPPSQASIYANEISYVNILFDFIIPFEAYQAT